MSGVENNMALERSTLLDFIQVDVNNLQAIENTPLRKKALPLTFPLSKEDLSHINALAKKFNSDKHLAGLAAPQFGISKQIIIFGIPENYEYAKALQRTILINPVYERLSNERDRDDEECRTVSGMTGPVRRYSKIRYKAYNLLGETVEGEAEGFLARVIQHEIDHLEGKLFIDRVPKGKLTTIREYLRVNDYLGENDTERDYFF